MTYHRLKIPERPSFVLRLISYGHTQGPLNVETVNEKARLTYSVRDVPSPPAQQRKHYTGLSPRMRKEILANKAAKEKLEKIIEQIEDKMTELEEERSREPSPEPEAVLKGQEPPREVLVCIMCEEGRHRSVSFIVELSKTIKRKGWDIKVEHRELGITDEDGFEDEDEEEDDSDEEVLSPTITDPKRKKSEDKFRKQKRSQSMRMLDGEAMI